MKIFISLLHTKSITISMIDSEVGAVYNKKLRYKTKNCGIAVFWQKVATLAVFCILVFFQKLWYFVFGIKKKTYANAQL